MAENPTPADLRAVATHEIETVLSKWRGVFGPDSFESGVDPDDIPDGGLLLGDWVIVFTNVDTDRSTWTTTIAASQTAAPTVVGLLELGKNAFLQ